MAVNRDALATSRLDSWKEIAQFLGRGERTVKRWETERGLPVHRVPGSGRSAVFAYTHELNGWLRSRPDADLDVLVDDSQRDDSPRATFDAVTDEPPVLTSPPAPDYAKSFTPSQRRAGMVILLLTIAGLIVYLSLTRAKAHATRASNQEAQDLYLKGRYFWNRRTPEDLSKAIDYFTQAIVKDPTDAQAYVGLADSYNLLREFGALSPAEAYPRALAAAQRAVELDDKSAEAHNSLAFATFWWSWQGTTAEREFRRALQLNPNFVRGHHWYATFLMALHRYPEALDQMEQAQRLEPSATAILADKGYLLWLLDRHQEALALLDQLETTEPGVSSVHNYLAIIAWEQKDFPKAIDEWKRDAELRHDENELALANARAKGFASGGLTGMWQSELSIQKAAVDQGGGSAYDLASTYAALGQKKEALAYLQIAFNRRESGILTGAPPIAELRDDPGYERLRAAIEERLKN